MPYKLIGFCNPMMRPSHLFRPADRRRRRGTENNTKNDALGSLASPMKPSYFGAGEHGLQHAARYTVLIGVRLSYWSKLGRQAAVVTLVAMLLHQADAQVYGSCISNFGFDVLLDQCHASLSPILRPVLIHRRVARSTRCPCV